MEDVMMLRKTLWFVSVVLSAAMLMLTFGPVHAQTPGAICEFDATGLCEVDSPIFDSGGNIGIGTSTPARTLHTSPLEIHSGGFSGGFSFGDRGSNNFVENPMSGERWVWYSLNGRARLWSGTDVLTILPGFPDSSVSIGPTGPFSAALQVNGQNWATALAVDGSVRVAGNLSVTGAKNAVVPLQDGQDVALTAEESTEVWFSDYGSAQLVKGRAVVQIDHVYLQTVNTEKDYHVFLTARGNPKGALYIDKETPSSFEIRESTGTADIKVSYRIVAKRKDFADERLKKVETPVASRERTTDSPQK